MRVITLVTSSFLVLTAPFATALAADEPAPAHPPAPRSFAILESVPIKAMTGAELSAVRGNATVTILPDNDISTDPLAIISGDAARPARTAHCCHKKHRSG